VKLPLSRSKKGVSGGPPEFFENPLNGKVLYSSSNIPGKNKILKLTIYIIAV